jgi:AcrR family transcriptional regulator
MQGGRGSRLLDRRYADVRLCVALAARDLFLEAHSTSVTVEEIAQRAGVSERTFYRHFASKADLITPLFERSTRNLIDTLNAADPGSTPIVETLVDILTDEMASGPEQYAELFELLIATPEYRLRWESIDDDLVEALTDWLERWSVHAHDSFTRCVTALMIMSSSRASYLEWLRTDRRNGVDGLRALHFAALSAAAEGWWRTRPR